jgi:phospholipid/cholesterol/gamma-HCH transport system substrate-binding protein
VSQPRSSYAVGTGLFIVLGFTALAYLATQTSSVANVRQGDSYIVEAQFTNIGQLKERAPVKIAGVRVGQVQSITLQPGHDVADVKLSIDKSYDKIPQDSVATIFTSGLLGDQYVGIEYGSAKRAVAGGGTLARTKSTQPLEEMLGKFFGAGGVVDNVGGSYAVKADFSNVGTLSAGAPVKMAGVVIGSQYVAIQPGGSPDSLKDGDEMILTQSAMQLEDLIGKFLVNGSPNDKKDAGNGK